MSVAAAIVVLGGLLALFVRAERAGRRDVPLVAILGVAMLEATLYADPGDAPIGLLHPAAGALTFRLVDVAIGAALLARLVVKGARPRLDSAGLLWIAFMVWFVGAAFVGVYAGHDPSLVIDQSKPIVYLGLFLFAAGVPAAQLAESTALGRLIRWAAVAGVALIAVDQTVGSVDVELPLLPLPELGAIGGDAGTMFAALGIVALLLGLYADRDDRLSLLLSVVPLFLVSLFADQRAAVLGLAVAVVIVAVVAGLTRRPPRVSPTEIGLAAFACIALVALPPFATAVFGFEPRVPIAEALGQTFLGDTERLTTEGRVNQYQAVDAVIAERLWLGWGLGKEYTYFEPGYKEFHVTSLTHNVLTDLLLRMGIVGFALFVVAVGASLIRGVAGWVVASDPGVAAVALAATGVLVSLSVKGLVESLFEKHLLMIAVGVCAGLTASALEAERERADEAAVAARPTYA